MSTSRQAGLDFTFQVRTDPTTPELWRALDITVARWVLSHGGSALLARVAGWASFADGQGDTVLSLSGESAGARGMPALDADARLALQAQPMVAMAAEALEATCPESTCAQASLTDARPDAPFVIDGDVFYLRRNYRHEVAVAAQLQQRMAPLAPALAAVTGKDLLALFNGSESAEESMQREAVARAPGQRLLVLTGGPGTGKTTTVLRMLLALSREHAARHAGQLPAIRIAAPTGKAAQRLADSLVRGAARLRAGSAPGSRSDRPGTPLPDAWQPHLEAALAGQSGTLHRLLGSRGRLGGFSHDRNQPLPADIVVVDEASMIDLALLRALLDALRDEAVLVLVGDADQLTSVATGSVLIDIVQALEQHAAGALVRLRHCFRSDAALVPINDAVRNGDAPAFQRTWKDAELAGRAVHHPLRDRRDLDVLLASWTRQLQTGLAEAGAFAVIRRSDAQTIQQCLAVLHNQQLLCALREGEFGALAANQTIETGLRRSLSGPGPSHARWYPGRAVMVTRNDPASGLFNGDVGLCLRLADEGSEAVLQVVFDGGDTGLRLFDPDDLPETEGAFALTVHKSQGSEYRQVAVLLTPDDSHPLLSRQLLYTALSRAQAQVQLWSTPAALDACLCRAARRLGCLAARLQPARR